MDKRLSIAGISNVFTNIYIFGIKVLFQTSSPSGKFVSFTTCAKSKYVPINAASTFSSSIVEAPCVTTFFKISQFVDRLGIRGLGPRGGCHTQDREHCC